ncbi:EamA family transporter RarD [Corynebacterium diphtheriae]
MKSKCSLMIYGILAYLLWGLFPAFFPLLLPAAPLEIIAHRILWTGVFMAIAVVITRQWRELLSAGKGQWLRLALASVLIAANWLIYVIAVNTGHVADAAFGYFINPIVNVVLGVAFLRESLRPLQSLSVVIAAAAVVVLSVFGGSAPLLSLSLALSFGFYGLVKKKVTISAAASLTAETFVLLPLALGYIIYLEITGPGTFVSHGPAHAGLLISAGAITAVPLLLFGLATKFIPLSTIGMLQYMTPTFQMLWAVFVVNENIEPLKWVGFGIIWISVAMYIGDVLLQRRQRTLRLHNRSK